MIELQDLQLVRAIHEQGNLVRAARVLGLGQPSLSRRLAALEARLKGVLFERRRSGVVATDLCRALLSEAGEILERMARLDRHLAEARGSQAQTLTITAGAYAAETIGMVAAAGMLAVHPATRVRLVAANWAEVPRMVLEREASLGVLNLGGLDAPAELLVEPLRPQPAILVVRAGHPLAAAATLSLADVVAWPFVLVGRLPRPVQARLVAAREAARGGPRYHPAFPALVHESPTIALRALPHSDAVAAVTVPIAIEGLNSGALVMLPFREPWMRLAWGIIRPRARRPTEAEDAYLDLLRSADREAEMLAREVLGAAGLCAEVEPFA